MTTTETTVNTDECFLEIQNHVLEGDYLGVQTNISIEECKCLCIDAESRYGSICQSIQYHYDRQTCLLNKESRFTDRESFIEDPYQDNMSSYFDYRCGGESKLFIRIFYNDVHLLFSEIALSLYVEEVCTKVIDIDLKTLGLDDIKPPSLRPDNAETNNDEASVEVKKDSETPSENELQSIKVVEETTQSPVSTSTEPAPPESTTTTVPESTSKHPKNTKKAKQPNKKQKSKYAEIEEVSEEKSDEDEKDATTTEAPTTTTTGYKPVGQCRYSALYQTVFNGSRLLKRVMVTSATQCFAACHAERCRSANLVQVEGVVKSCELYRDSIIDFRRTDVLTFDASAVHFDSIQCEDA